MWGSVLPLASPSTSWVGWWWGRRGRGSGGGREQEEEEGQKEEEEEEGQAQEAEEQQEEQEEQEKQEKQEQEAPGLPAPSRPARAGGHCADTLPMAAADGCGRWLSRVVGASARVEATHTAFGSLPRRCHGRDDEHERHRLDPEACLSLRCCC